jgi:hypothetical protein
VAIPNIPAALVVLIAHLTAAGAVLSPPLTDVSRGLPVNAGRQIRCYWAGEVLPPHMAGARVLNGESVGLSFTIEALWPLPERTGPPKISLDTEMQTLAGEVRTRINADSQLGDNVQDLTLGYATPGVVTVNGALHVSLTWQLDLSYVEYPIGA